MKVFFQDLSSPAYHPWSKKKKNSKVRLNHLETKVYKWSCQFIKVQKDLMTVTDKVILNINKFSATDCDPPAYSKQIFFLPSAVGSEEKTLKKSFSIYSIQLVLQ